MAKVFAVDDRPNEIVRQWRATGCGDEHELVPPKKFCSLEQTWKRVKATDPDIILVGYGLGKASVTGLNVIHHLSKKGYGGLLVANSGAGVVPFADSLDQLDGSANKSPEELERIIEELTN